MKESMKNAAALKVKRCCKNPDCEYCGNTKKQKSEYVLCPKCGQPLWYICSGCGRSLEEGTVIGKNIYCDECLPDALEKQQAKKEQLIRIVIVAMNAAVAVLPFVLQALPEVKKAAKKKKPGILTAVKKLK